MAEEKRVFENSVRSCKRCMFAEAVPSPVVGQWVGACRYSCPVPVLVPVVQGQQRGLSVQPMFPPVDEKCWCHRYEPEMKILP
jgi:ferredoxin